MRGVYIQESNEFFGTSPLGRSTQTTSRRRVWGEVLWQNARARARASIAFASGVALSAEADRGGGVVEN